MKLDSLSLPITYEVNSSFDDRFKKVTIWVMHDKLNLNNTYFKPEVIEDAKESLKNIPILAFVEEQDGADYKDFGGHEVKIKVTKNEIDLVYLGRPIGVVPSENNYRIEELDGKNFVVVDGYIWTKYANEALDIFERDGVKNHSMEIKILLYSVDNENKYTNIDKYIYTGLTLIGDNHKPAMKGSKAELYTFNNDYYTMVEELNTKLKSFYENQSSNNIDINVEEGGQGVDKFKELFEKYSITAEEVLASFKDINFEEISLEDMESKIKEFKGESYSLSGEQFTEELISAVSGLETMHDYYGETYSRFYYRDYEESIVYAIDRGDDYKLVGFNYSKSGDSINIDKDSLKRYKVQYAPFEDGDPVVGFTVIPKEIIDYEISQKEKELQETFETEKNTLIKEYQDKVDELTNKYTELENSSKELKEYQENKVKEEREMAETELFTKFTAQLTKEEIDSIKENSANFTLEDLEEKLYVLVGKKLANFTVDSTNKKGIKFNVIPDKEKPSKAWSTLMDK